MEELWAHFRAQEKIMKKLCTLVVVVSASSFAFAADSACMTAAKDKKLSGAAQTSFVKKCEKDATAKCELDTKEKKLAGAAKTSHMKKCVAETGPTS
jgi:hypothetical protein